MLPKPNSSGHCGVIIEDLQLSPLLAQIDTNVRASHGQVGSALVEAEIPDLVSLVQLDRLKVLQLPQIPKFDASVVSGSRQVVTVLGEGESGDLSTMPIKVGYVLLLEKEKK